MDCKPQAISEQHYGDRPGRPDVYGILIPGKRGKIVSVFYTAAGEGPHPTVLLIHGIPGCERNYDVAHELRRRGFHVMTFHYSGNWGSDGDYSIAHDLEDTNTVLDYLLADERVDKAHIYAVGHSLGGFVCGQVTAKRKEIQGGVLMMPCDIGRLPEIAKDDPAAYQNMLDVFDESAAWLHGTSAKALLDEVEAHAQEYRLESVAEGLAKKPMLIIGGELDNCTPPPQNCEPVERAIRAAGGTRLESVRFPTDHFSSDYRLTLTQTVSDFLSGLLTD